VLFITSPQGVMKEKKYLKAMPTGKSFFFSWNPQPDAMMQ
jgi:hypothetical protein